MKVKLSKEDTLYRSNVSIDEIAIRLMSIWTPSPVVDITGLNLCLYLSVLDKCKKRKLH